MIYFHKILPTLLSPVFFILLCLTFGLILRSHRLIALSLFLFATASLPLISEQLIAFLEFNHPPRKLKEIHEADSIVVLSGMVKTIRSEDDLIYEWTEASDRIFAGINLYKAQKAQSLILTRGLLPWSNSKPEGEYLAEVAFESGVAREHIILTGIVENTDQEAKAIAQLLDEKAPSIILVTSAYHMPRAIMVFKALGIDVEPYPVDFQSNSDKFTLIKLFPTATAFAQTSFFIREMIGRIFYTLRY